MLRGHLPLLCRALLVGVFASQVCMASDWSWQLSNERYRGLNVFERAQYDKAANLYKKGSYRAASSEFEKFKIQFPDSSVLPYVIFMRARCLHEAKVRHKAIKVYNEVLDYFADEVEYAAPALFFLGVAHIDNGDVRKGMEFMVEMVEDEEYQKHPLAAGALRRLADEHWNKKEHELALRYWKQVVRDFSDSNRHEANRARDNATIYYIRTGNYTGYEDWLVGEDAKDNAPHRKWVAVNAVDRAMRFFDWNAHNYSKFDKDKRSRDMRRFFDYFRSTRQWFEKAKDIWAFYDKALWFVAHRYNDKKERQLLTEAAVAFVKTVEDKGDANNKYAWLSDRLRDAGDFAGCRHCIEQMTDRPYATYKEYEMLARQNKWDNALSGLENIETMGNERWEKRARGERARVYKDVLRQYEKAIELYRQIAEPPGTLWAIQECHKRRGKLNEALATLTEIENMFPKDAPRAAWHKASYYHEAGRGKKAIAQARKILKAYKKSHEASLAHQLLEKYGIATGGGVFEED